VFSKGKPTAPDFYPLHQSYWDDFFSPENSERRLRLLSFNIQVGINTHSYRHYLTRSWQHFLPHGNRLQNLDRISELLGHFDIVALQEADGGSIRSGHVNQVEYLADRAGFPHWYQQLNRNFGRFAQHSNGLLSRLKPLDIQEHKLPALIPGRGAMFAEFGSASNPLLLVIMHLSLSKRAQTRQLNYVKEQIADYKHVVLMGDMNNHLEQMLNDSPLADTDLRPANTDDVVLNTFPSWRPKRAIDHILVSSSLHINRVGVLDYPVSDHLPIAMDIALPDDFPCSELTRA